MGILQGTKSEKTPAAAKRRSLAAEFPKLGPLKKQGVTGFSTYRENEPRRKVKDKSVSDDEMESDSDDGGIIGKMEDINEAEVKKESNFLSPDDAERAGHVAEGIRKMKLKRQHSAEPLNSNGVSNARKSSKSGSPSAASTPKLVDESLGTTPPPQPSALPAPISTGVEVKREDEFHVGSPLKKQRSSMADFDEEIKRRLGGGMTLPGTIGEVLGSSGSTSQSAAGASGLQFGGALKKEIIDDDDGEL